MLPLQNEDRGTDGWDDVIQQIRSKTPVYEEILRRDFSRYFGQDYKYEADAWVGKILNQVTSLGQPLAVHRPSTLPAFMSISEETDFSKKALTGIGYIDGHSVHDTKFCCFTGACFIKESRMVLADWNNCCLKMFSSKGALVCRLDFPNHPWDVAALPGLTKVVVTIPGEPRVYIVECGELALEPLSAFDVDCEVWGVVPIADKLAVTCNPWTKKSPYIKLFSYSGEGFACFRFNDDGSPLFGFPEYVATDSTELTMYVSDARNDTVVAIEIASCDVVFTYRDRQLVTPAGLAVDNQGYVYVCGRQSKAVHQLSKTGEQVNTLGQHTLFIQFNLTLNAVWCGLVFILIWLN